MQAAAEVSVAAVQSGLRDDDSDYGDFASDEEDIIIDLLSSIPVPNEPPEAPLIATDIEDYEEPRGVRLPKVLGTERRPGKWQPQVHIQREDQGLRGDITSNLENEATRKARQSADHERSASIEPQYDRTEPDTRSPLERFRRPPKKSLSVTDLVSPAWCELQYFYTLAKHGRKKRTPAMKQGSTIHKALEDEVHTTVPVEITTQEDSWGLRIWNIIQGLRTLRDTGRTRELEIWGLIGGEIVNGVVDELGYVCPDPKLEAESSERYATARAAMDNLPEYQTSISDYLLSHAGGGGPMPSKLRNGRDSSQVQGSMAPPPTPKARNDKSIYITDIKTRTTKSLPAGASIRPTIMQLHLYHHMIENLAQNNFPLRALAERYGLDIESTFSDSFIAQVGSLNQDFFDTVSEQLGRTEDQVTASQLASSQDSAALLLAHNNLSSMWSLMIQQFQETFLVKPTFSRLTTPTSTPQSIVDTPMPSTRLSPLMTAIYLSSTTSETLGSKSILFDASLLKAYLEDNLAWWRGEREAQGVQLQEAWKCRSCDFRDDCSWIHERDAAAVEEVRARRKMREIAGVERSGNKSEV